MHFGLANYAQKKFFVLTLKTKMVTACCACALQNLSKHLCAFQIELDYLSVGFWREEYQVTWRKTSTNNQEDQQQTQCSYSVTFAGHIGLRQELSPDCTPVPCSPKLHARPLVLTFVSFTYDLMLIGYNPEFK